MLKVAYKLHSKQIMKMKIILLITKNLVKPKKMAHTLKSRAINNYLSGREETFSTIRARHPNEFSII